VALAVFKDKVLPGLTERPPYSEPSLPLAAVVGEALAQLEDRLAAVAVVEPFRVEPLVLVARVAAVDSPVDLATLKPKVAMAVVEDLGQLAGFLILVAVAELEVVLPARLR